MEDLKPGPELNALIAINFFGWIQHDDYKHLQRSPEHTHTPMLDRGSVPNYSYDPNLATEIIRQMDEKDFAFYIAKKSKNGNWECTFQQYYPNENGNRETHTAEASSFSGAICIAALKAIGV